MLKIEKMCKNICLIQKKIVPLHPKIRNNDFATGGYQSGQMGQTVNLLVFTFGGSNPSPPTKGVVNNVCDTLYFVMFFSMNKSFHVVSTCVEKTLLKRTK